MKKRSRRYRAISDKSERQEMKNLMDAVVFAKENATAKFDESIEMHVRLSVDPRHADQQVRSTIVLPHGTGVVKRLLVIASGEKLKEAMDAGADFVGGEDMVQKIDGGWLDFDAVVVTPDMMKSVGKLGKVLGPRGLMPSAKTGTVTFDVAGAINEIKAGKVEFRVDKFAIIHNSFGKASFPIEELYDNAKALLGAILKAKPSATKGQYIRSLALASTMGASIRVDSNVAAKEIAE